MFHNKRFLAIIPARSGSKGLKDKNIKELHGKPMMAYTIEAAKNSGVFDNIIVSTDSDHYAEVATEYGAEVPFLRPGVLSNDLSGSTDVIVYTIAELKRHGFTYDYFMFLQPTSPLRNAEDILNCAKLLIEKGANSVVSVCSAEHSPLLMNTLDESLSMTNFISSTNNKRRQDLSTFYRLNGAIYLSNADYFLKNESFYKDKSFAYIMDERRSVDIDNELDFEFISFLIQKYKDGLK